MSERGSRAALVECYDCGAQISHGRSCTDVESCLRRQIWAERERRLGAENVLEKVIAFIGPNRRRGYAEALNELRDLIDREKNLATKQRGLRSNERSEIGR